VGVTARDSGRRLRSAEETIVASGESLVRLGAIKNTYRHPGNDTPVWQAVRSSYGVRNGTPLLRCMDCHAPRASIASVDDTSTDRPTLRAADSPVFANGRILRSVHGLRTEGSFQ